MLADGLCQRLAQQLAGPAAAAFTFALRYDAASPYPWERRPFRVGQAPNAKLPVHPASPRRQRLRAGRLRRKNPMARGINKVILVGNLGNDPDTKYTQGGMAITRISLATTSMRKDRDGNNQERTEWHRVVFFGKLGEIAGEYLRKGSQVYVEGELRYDKYTGQDGVEKYSTDIIANEMQMLGGRGEGGASGGGGYGGDRPQRQAPPQRQQEYAPRRQQPAPQPSAPPMDDFADDDIPF